MRRHNFTSHKKLPILILCVSVVVAYAKEKTKDTNIICFAAKEKWVCAPADKQQIANQKAEELLQQSNSEQRTSNVVIKTLNIPTFRDNKISTSPALNTSTITMEEPAVAETTVQTPEEEITPEKTPMPVAEIPIAQQWSYQLIGVSTPQSAINYVNNRKLNKSQVRIIQSKRSNMDWWIVLYGTYKDKQSALDDRANLPNAIGKPWLRPLNNLIVNGQINEF